MGVICLGVLHPMLHQSVSEGEEVSASDTPMQEGIEHLLGLR